MHIVERCTFHYFYFILFYFILFYFILFILFYFILFHFSIIKLGPSKLEAEAPAHCATWAC